jgi:hypothetical protein
MRITTRFVFSAALLAGVAVQGEAGTLINQPAQFPNTFNGLTSQNQASGASFQSYDNFTLSGNPGDLISIVSVGWQGIYWDPSGVNRNPNPNPIDFTPPLNTSPPAATNYFGVGFFSNTPTNLPGTLLNPQPEAIQLKNLAMANVGQAQFGPNNNGGNDTVNVYNFSADLAVSSPFQLHPGTYWLSIVWFAPNNSAPPLFVWTSGTGGDGTSAQLTYGQQNAISAIGDRAFSLSSGNGLTDVAVPEPGTLAIMGALFLVGGATRVRRWRMRGC